MKKIFYSVLGLFLVANVFGQSLEINDVKKNKFKGVYEIRSGQDGAVEGYYTYYMVEKSGKGMRTFEFSIIDKDVKEVIKTQIDLHKWASINNVVFNGKFLLVSYDDTKNKQIVFNVIDLNGKIVKKKSIPTEKKRLTSSTVYADATGNGFYVVKPEMKKPGYGYSIEKIDNDLARVWKTDQIPVKGSKSVSDLINTADRFAIWEAYSPKGKRIKPQIVCFDAKTGQKIYTKDGFDGVSTILYNQLRIDEQNNLYLGGAYVDGVKIKNVNNAGIYIMKLDPNGKEVLYTKVNNKEKIQPALASASKGFTLGSKDKVFVEDLILDGDQIIVISEMFRKNANMTPKKIQQSRDLITGKYVGWARNSDDKAKCVLEIMDFMLFKFNQEGKLGEIKPIEKENYNKITCWNPYCHMYGMQLAKALSNLGWFDYCFTTEDNNGQKIMVCKNNASKRKPEVFFYTLDDSYAHKKINLKHQGKIDLEKAKVGYFNALKSDNGNVVVVYHQRKLKRITINKESVN